MEMAGSSIALDIYAPTQDLKFTMASNVNVSNFVSVKLSNRGNYKIWRAQMLCLIKSQALLHFIDAENSFMVDKDVPINVQCDELVKGWIFGSMNEKVLKDFVDSSTAREVWMKLESAFNPPISDSDTQDELGFMFRTESIRDIPEIRNTTSLKLKEELYEASIEGCWWKAKSILKNHKNAAKEAITTNGNTILHLAVERGHNYFIEKLLEFIKDGKDIEAQNFKGRTALHTAARVGNIHAAELLVKKRTKLLGIVDSHQKSPFDIAIDNPKFISVSENLMTSVLSSNLSLYPEGYQKNAIYAAIFTKRYDLASTLLENYHKNATGMDDILLGITITFPTDLGLMESFIRPSFHSIYQKIFVRGSLLFNSNFLDKCIDDILWVVKICKITCCSSLGKISMILIVPVATLYPIYHLIFLLILVLRLPFSMLYYLLWKVLAVLTVPPIKNIKKKKQEYEQAKKVLGLVCKQMGTTNDGYGKSIIEAIRQDTYEVVDEILFMSPSTINYTDEEGHNIIQLAIINRSEKVYNLIYHIIECTRSYRTMRDFSMNNLVHLAGRLAPSFVLGRTTGAALQLQRELLWREEVEKLLLPIELRDENMYGETPTMVFTREHTDLMKQGENWMKTTAESCSITAALIVTIVFAAAITVPGGSIQESGIPVFKKEIAFTVFAVANAFSLFTATTSLLLFLSILTTRFSERDFLVSLPTRLILGLLTLFLSTTTMIVAFGAILFLVFCDQRPWMLAPIFGFSCLPISVIVTIKLPLLVDLVKSTYVPIFGEHNYLDSCKINRKNTTFM